MIDIDRYKRLREGILILGDQGRLNKEILAIMLTLADEIKRLAVEVDLTKVDKKL